jgi:hypothetical protein
MHLSSSFTVRFYGMDENNDSYNKNMNLVNLRSDDQNLVKSGRPMFCCISWIHGKIRTRSSQQSRHDVDDK